MISACIFVSVHIFLHLYALQGQSAAMSHFPSTPHAIETHKWLFLKAERGKMFWEPICFGSFEIQKEQIQDLNL